MSLWRGLSSVILGAGQHHLPPPPLSLSPQELHPPESHLLTGKYRSRTRRLLCDIRNGQAANGWQCLWAPSSRSRYTRPFVKLHLAYMNLTRDTATSGACATIASDAFMNPFDGELRYTCLYCNPPQITDTATQSSSSACKCTVRPTPPSANVPAPSSATKAFALSTSRTQPHSP